MHATRGPRGSRARGQQASARERRTTTNWVVVLEVVRRPIASPVDGAVLQRLLQLLYEADPDGCEPVVLYAEDRYALHLSVSASSIPQAVVIAVLRWEDVTKRLGLGGWDPQRAEVITWEDFQKESQTLVDHTSSHGEP